MSKPMKKREGGSKEAGLNLNVNEAKKRAVVVWPEWNDADVAQEKWDVGPAKAAGKPGAAKGASNLFEDPEGRCEMPASLKVFYWKRPNEYLADKTPMIVDVDGVNAFDLIPANKHVHESELMRWITSEITALWQQSEIQFPEGTAPTPPDVTNPVEMMYTHSWRPWEHIYTGGGAGVGKPAANKGTPAGTALNWPQYNPGGKYIVKLYWMGCWRKLIVDDLLPFDQCNQLLLPVTTVTHELWPLILTKALLKVAALDYLSGGTSKEFGDFSVIHCLTGWLPEIIPLQFGHMDKIWELLKVSLPEFKLPEPPSDPSAATTDNALSPEELVAKEEKEKQDKLAAEAATKKKPADKPDVKDKNKDKKKGDDKQKDKPSVAEEAPLPEHPEMIIFATYQGLPRSPARITLLSAMADASERLRQHGLSHNYPHPVLLTQSRSCPLIPPPPPPPPEPAWKMIRPKKKPNLPSAEPVDPVCEKSIQSIHITSPFVNYMTCAMEIPSDTHRPKSALERGGTRPGSSSMVCINETSEEAGTNGQPPPTPAQAPPSTAPVPPTPVPPTPAGRPTRKSVEETVDTKKKKVPTATLR